MGKNKLLGNWADFLCDPANKQELFAFLSNKTVDCPEEKEIIITSGVTALFFEEPIDPWHHVIMKKWTPCC